MIVTIPRITNNTITSVGEVLNRDKSNALARMLIKFKEEQPELYAEFLNMTQCVIRKYSVIDWSNIAMDLITFSSTIYYMTAREIEAEEMEKDLS